MKKFIAIVAAFAIVTAGAGEFPNVSVKKVRTLADSKKATIIDVNGTESYAKGHVPGALDFEAVKDNLAAKLPADKNATIIAYCGGPRCSAYEAAAKAAKDLGYKHVKHMKAGITGWRDAGQPMEKAQ